MNLLPYAGTMRDESSEELLVQQVNHQVAERLYQIVTSENNGITYG